MRKVNIHDIKAHLSAYLARVKKGERIIICKRNVPVAELHAITAAISAPRPVGLAKGKFKIPTSFFDDLPEDIMRSFEEDKDL
jgi:antitoxin (DNA-binding transcriptional repressor) of toxin-antitoxin stability system